MSTDGARLGLPDGSTRPLTRRLAIGRGAGNEIRLAAKSVSREHALLLFADGRWWIEDRGSANGTWVNESRVPFATPHPLRHADRIRLGDEELVFSFPAEETDADRTDRVEGGLRPAPPARDLPALSPFQRQVVRALCGAWLSGSTLDELPTNDQIAAQLGTPAAGAAVKAALRRIYAKAGVSDVPAHAKRRTLCRIARENGWL